MVAIVRTNPAKLIPVTLIRNFIVINGVKLSYLDTQNYSAPQTVIILPSGSATSEMYGKVGDYFGDQVRLIIPDYIGRGESDFIEGPNSVEVVSDYVLQLIKKLSPANPVAFALSYGTLVTHELVKREPKLFTKVVLIAAGEYFDPVSRVALKKIMAPSLENDNLREAYRYLAKVAMFNPKYLDWVHSKSLVSQLLCILDHKVNFDKGFVCNCPSYAFNFKLDVVVRPGSFKKVGRAYNVKQVHEILGGHPLTAGAFLGFLSRERQKVLSVLAQ